MAGDLDVPVETGGMYLPAAVAIGPISRIPFQSDLRRFAPLPWRGFGYGPPRAHDARARAGCDCRAIVRTTPDICAASACGKGR